MIEVHEPVQLKPTHVAATISGPSGTDSIWFESTVPLIPAGEAWASVGLHLAMASGLPLQCHVPVSRQWHENQPRIQQILATWYPRLRPVPVVAEVVARTSSPGRVSASFFSGGVDAFSTALEPRAEPLSVLLMVQGFDIRITDTEFWDRTTARLSETAASLNFALERARTNVRQALDRAGDYASVTHGAALASVALVHQTRFKTIFVPSTHTYNDLFAWGSHPLLDSLWSSEAIQIRHDGSHLTRFQKTARIAANPIALQALRVCFMKSGAYNCGRCEKCIRTQCALLICGAPDVAAFETPLSPETVRELYPRDANTASFIREMVLGGDPSHPIVQALAEVLWRYDAAQWRAQFVGLWRNTTPQRFHHWLGDRLHPRRRRYI